MATRPASTTSSRQPAKSTPPSGRARKPEPQPAERDEHYDLISVLYHSLQGAETSARYLSDAREAGDGELVAFLQQAKLKYEQLASSAKRLLASRLETASDEASEEDEELGDEDEEDEEDAEDEDDEDEDDED